MKRIALLKNPVQEYRWGSKTFIPELLGEPSPATRPVAELWIGVHPKGVSRAYWDGAWISLPELIQRDPENILGKDAARSFQNQLPFLFKILAAAMPLSIQAHPNLTQACQGFAQENSLGIPLADPARNYRDQNHKPEILCALTPFDALKGFRKAPEVLALFERLSLPSLVTPLRLLRKDRTPKGLAGFFSTLLTLGANDPKQVLSELVKGAESLASSDPAFTWVIRLHQCFPGDVGVFAPLLLNLIHLEPGEALYIDSGELHSYLGGAGVELMANSDNVIRAGLTEKHADLPELLRILRFEEKPGGIIQPQGRNRSEWVYPTPAREFVLSMLSLQEGMLYQAKRRRSLEIMICTRGKAEVKDLDTDEVLSVSRGTAFLVPAVVKDIAMQGEATLYKAAIPGEEKPA
ncbi:MAG: mannose-6-phosphate isomerase, class I [Desulfobacterota bacterium]|nr:mannose-6-phosphate isomerase, class I [Thermodesulfobacteriota bacterium]